jgi:regulator of protease activity HflC (stomatin/prohibitin superfamily)
MELLDLLENLEQAINSGTGVPATGRVLVDKDKTLSAINHIKSALPEEIQEAQEMLQMRENLINQAVVEARRIKAVAEQEAKGLITDSEINREAQRQSQEIEAGANERAKDILDKAGLQAGAQKLEADRYAHKTLQKLEIDLNILLETVKRGLELLTSEPSPEDEMLESTD